MDFVEANPVTAVVAVAVSKRQFTTRECIGNDLSDFSDLIVLCRRADAENLAVNNFPRRFERACDGVGDVPHVSERTPWRSVAGHTNFLPRPREAGQIVQNDIEAHPRRWPVSRGVPQKSRRKIIRCHRGHVSFDHDLAFGVCRLRVYFGLLVFELSATGAIHAARRRVDEPRNPDLSAPGRELHRPPVIDPERQGGIVLCQRIVQKLRTTASNPSRSSRVMFPYIFPDERIEARKAVIEASIRVETSVEADYFVPSFDYRGREHDAHITFYTSYEHSHNVFPSQVLFFSSLDSSPSRAQSMS
jgi:hypothetical protein